MKRHLTTILILLVLVVGIAVMAYPSVSDWLNTQAQARVVAGYQDTVAEMSQEDRDGLLAEADNYNAQLAANKSAFFNPQVLEGYNQILDITGTGVMGYVSIDKLDLELPIYHGLDESVLQVATGHLEGTSFPVGGASTHSVISGHRGLPSATLFTNLDRLEPGDRFTVNVLDRSVTYEVDQIRIVLPTETSDLQIVDGEDHMTLLTCTPYGVNSHRMLVRGVRVPDGAGSLHITSEARRIDPMLVAPAVGLPILLAWLVFMLVRYRRRKA